MVDAGLMNQEDSLAERLRRDWIEPFYAERDARVAGDPEASLGTSGKRPATASRLYGAEGKSGGRAGSAPGDQGISPSPLQPNFDEAGAQRLRAANAAYAGYAQTYKNPIIAPGLRTTGYSGQYRMPDAVFIKRAIQPGEKGFEAVNAHLAAVKDNPTAVAAMQQAILDPLRRTAQPTGMIHPNMLARWKESYGPALRALDRVAPGFSANFDDAARANSRFSTSAPSTSKTSPNSSVSLLGMR